MKTKGFRFLTVFGLIALLGGTAQAAPASASSANVQADASFNSGGMTCFYTQVNLRNVDNHLASISEAMNDMVFWDLVSQVSGTRSPILAEAMDIGYDSLVAAHENLTEFKAGSFDPRNGTELCAPAYSCTRDDGTPTKAFSRRQCTRCSPTTPPGVPPGGLGATSCKLCAAHFGATPEEAMCDDNDAY